MIGLAAIRVDQFAILQWQTYYVNGQWKYRDPDWNKLIAPCDTEPTAKKNKNKKAALRTWARDWKRTGDCVKPLRASCLRVSEPKQNTTNNALITRVYGGLLLSRLFLAQQIHVTAGVGKVVDFDEVLW